MKSDLEKKFDEQAKEVLDEFYMTLYCMTPSEDAYQDLCKLGIYLQFSVIHEVKSVAFDSVVENLHECSNELVEKFKAISEFMKDFYEENKDNPVTVISKIGIWNHSLYIDMYTRIRTMAELMEFRMKASGKDIK